MHISQTINPLSFASFSLHPMLGRSGNLDFFKGIALSCKLPSSKYPSRIVQCSGLIGKRNDSNDTDVLPVEDAWPVSELLANEEINQNSPKKKRRRMEQAEETGACKRCNCKKSKYLKQWHGESSLEL